MTRAAGGASSEASAALSPCSARPPGGWGGLGGVGLRHERHGGWVGEDGGGGSRVRTIRDNRD